MSSTVNTRSLACPSCVRWTALRELVLVQTQCAQASRHAVSHDGSERWRHAPLLLSCQHALEFATCHVAGGLGRCSGALSSKLMLLSSIQALVARFMSLRMYRRRSKGMCKSLNHCHGAWRGWARASTQQPRNPSAGEWAAHDRHTYSPCFFAHGLMELPCCLSTNFPLMVSRHASTTTYFNRASHYAMSQASF